MITLGDVRRIANLWIAALAIAYSLVFTSNLMSLGYSFKYAFIGVYPIPVRVPFTNLYYMGIFPVSLVIIAVFLIVMDMRHGWRALPLTAMAAGAYDFFNHHNVFQWQAYVQDISLWPQLAFMVGGWFFAGMPNFKFSGKWFWLALGTGYLFLAQNTTVFPFLDLRFYQVAFFLFVAMDTVPTDRFTRLRHWLTG